MLMHIFRRCVSDGMAFRSRINHKMAEIVQNMGRRIYAFPCLVLLFPNGKQGLSQPFIQLTSPQKVDGSVTAPLGIVLNFDFNNKE